MIEKYKDYAPVVSRLAISIVFLWFGFNQVFDSSSWMGWLPQWVYNLPIEPTTFILMNGLFESVLGSMLIIGLYPRWVALLLGLHLISITFTVGYNDIGVRDFGLALATLAIFLHGPDKYCVHK